MRARRVVAAVAGLALVSALTAPVAAAASPAARATDDSCPAGSVPEDALSDVAAGSAHETAVDCIVWWQIAKGVSRSSYAPELAIERAQMATFLANLITKSGGTLPEPSSDRFSDDNDSVHEDNINRLAEAGVVEGLADGGYGPTLVVSRGQMATLLVAAYDERARQAAEPPLPAGPDAFADDNGTTHEKSIDKAAAAGIAAGTASGEYAERSPVQRDQMASFVARTLDLLVESGVAQPPPTGPGALDASFGQQGIVTVKVGDGYDEARALARDEDDRLVLGGESSVVLASRRSCWRATTRSGSASGR